MKLKNLRTGSTTEDTYNTNLKITKAHIDKVNVQFLYAAGDTYTFMNNGQRLQYTAKSTVNYVNKAENVTMYWDLREGDKAVKGTYIIQVFSDDNLLGETRMILQ
mgnify:CR=1 FL=1